MRYEVLIINRKSLNVRRYDSAHAAASGMLGRQLGHHNIIVSINGFDEIVPVDEASVTAIENAIEEVVFRIAN